MNPLTDRSGVGWEGFTSRGVRVAHDENIVDAIGTRAERIAENALWLEDDLRVVTWGLASRAAIEVPLWKSLNGFTLNQSDGSNRTSELRDKKPSQNSKTMTTAVARPTSLDQ